MNATTYEGYADLIGGLKHAGMLLYIVNPYETTFERLEDVPDYHLQVWFPFFLLIALENAILYAKKPSSFRLNDHVSSLSHWIMQETGRVAFRGAEYYAYIVIYEKFRLSSLTWDSPWTWYMTAVAVDFCYYWVHRANHEVLFLWAHHQVHHSSEEFNLVVGLRQSVLQQWCSFMFYLPLAFFIPPSHFVAHHQFNLIYQLWIHTTVINDLGPLEWIFNTPKHHRVHHGCNIYCLDTNYGGVLIVWDRIFGTFAQERAKEEIIYGLVVSPQSYNPLYLQVFYALAMIGRSLDMGNLRDRLAVYWKGPSWQPGLPRLGLDEFKVNVTSRVKYNPQLPTWQSCYIVLHFCLVLYTHCQLYDEKTFSQELHGISSTAMVINNVCALTTLGLLFDRSKFAGLLELTRCLCYLYFFRYNLITSSTSRSLFALPFITHFYVASCCLWIYDILRIAATR
ncbi:alkylglycerol monooxygenase isoform X2 [Nasonia vitripennis]|uniref:Alkylglycerol monooxygenase n=1 Tax=Nasonia vitripennis TaxID=7425 RepID=A0A7M7QSZ3_NASVI|nr:alkylglycerol monooxygenase isoform X2 [Nasonia vitripennis]XP_032454125.1 alkylglycerol monooxygenase isoform X2 [Nasonia vitripennis]XP_032454126.1 alkylglycerol monooxygenase isoform X2 [Nasonia vitripennis]